MNCQPQSSKKSLIGLLKAKHNGSIGVHYVSPKSFAQFQNGLDLDDISFLRAELAFCS